MKKLLILSALLVLISGCSKISLDNYEKIKVGMDKQEIVDLLGDPEICEEKAIHTNCIWGSESKHIRATLIADKVTVYSERGL